MNGILLNQTQKANFNITADDNSENADIVSILTVGTRKNNSTYGENSFACGKNNVASGTNSVVIGGSDNNSKNENSILIGKGLISNTNNQIVIGTYNNQNTTSSIVIGCGTESSRYNAITINPSQTTFENSVRMNNAVTINNNATVTGSLTATTISGTPAGSLLTRINNAYDRITTDKIDFISNTPTKEIKSISLSFAWEEEKNESFTYVKDNLNNAYFDSYGYLNEYGGMTGTFINEDNLELRGATIETSDGIKISTNSAAWDTRIILSSTEIKTINSAILKAINRGENTTQSLYQETRSIPLYIYTNTNGAVTHSYISFNSVPNQETGDEISKVTKIGDLALTFYIGWEPAKDPSSWPEDSDFYGQYGYLTFYIETDVSPIIGQIIAVVGTNSTISSLTVVDAIQYLFTQVSILQNQ